MGVLLGSAMPLPQAAGDGGKHLLGGNTSRESRMSPEGLSQCLRPDLGKRGSSDFRIWGQPGLRGLERSPGLCGPQVMPVPEPCFTGRGILVRPRVASDAELYSV